MTRVRVFKVEGRWWWWCRECWTGEWRTSWRWAFRLGRGHATKRHHGASPVRYLGEPPC